MVETLLFGRFEDDDAIKTALFAHIDSKNIHKVPAKDFVTLESIECINTDDKGARTAWRITYSIAPAMFKDAMRAITRRAAIREALGAKK